jgi:hypothetical protein
VRSDTNRRTQRYRLHTHRHRHTQTHTHRHPHIHTPTDTHTRSTAIGTLANLGLLFGLGTVVPLLIGEVQVVPERPVVARVVDLFLFERVERLA